MREQGIDGLSERCSRPPLGHPDADTLAMRMDSSIGPACARCRNRAITKSREDDFHVPLDGPDVRLPLPP